MFILIQHVLFFLLPLILLMVLKSGILIVCVSILIACFEILLWGKREKKYSNLNWCHPVPVFVLGYCIVFYQLPFCYLAGYDLSDYAKYIIFAPEKISYCVVLATIGLAAFFVGEQLFFIIKNDITNKQIKSTINIEKLQFNLNRISLITLLILFITIINFSLFLISLGSSNAFLGFAYETNALKIKSLSNYYQFSFNISLYLVILFQIVRLVILKPNSIYSYLRCWNKSVLIVLVITMIPFIMSGDRGSYLLPVALFTAPYFILVKPLKFHQAVVILVLMAFLLALVGETRGRSDISWKKTLQSKVENISDPSQWPTMELAHSYGTFNIATQYFPEKYSYNYGIGTLYHLVSIVPFLFRMSGIGNFNKENNYKFTSSLFFTNILTRGTFSSGSGTSSLADIYMDYGPWGIPIVMFFWGIIMAWITQRATATYSPIFVFLYAYYAYFSIYLNRSSFFFGWNILLWVILLFSLINTLYLKTPIKKVSA